MSGGSGEWRNGYSDPLRAVTRLERLNGIVHAGSEEVAREAAGRIRLNAEDGGATCVCVTASRRSK